MQYGFLTGRGMVNAAFTVRQMQKFMQKNQVYFVFIDLEKAFDMMSRVGLVDTKNVNSR